MRSLEMREGIGDSRGRPKGKKGNCSLTDFFSFKTLPCSCLEAKSFDRNYIVKGTLAAVLNDRPSLEVEKYPVVPLFLQSVQRNCYTRQSVGFYFSRFFCFIHSTFTVSLRAETPLSLNASMAKLYFWRVVRARTSRRGRWSAQIW